MDSRLDRTARVTMVLLAAAALASCGGGGYAVPPTDGNQISTTQKLNCTKACTPSDSVAIDQLRQSYVLVNDGQKARAYAAFGTGSDQRASVELDGQDQAQLVTPQGTQKFYAVQASDMATATVNAIFSLFSGPLPYGSDLSQAQAAQAVQFQFIRGLTVYTSSATLPPNFSFTAPANNAVLPIAARTLDVRLSSTAATTLSVGALNCSDTNGNTATSSLNALTVQPQPVAAGSTSATYSVAIGPYLDGLSFSTGNPRGLLAQCSLTLTAAQEVQGQAATGFASTVVVARQSRQVDVTLR